MLVTETYTSPETTFSNGGTIELIVPSGITILSASVRFCGISSTRTGWAEDTYSSDISEVVNGGVSPGGTFGASVTAASCRYIGRSSYSQGGGTPGNTGWADSGQSQNGNNVSNSITVPTIPGGGEFQSGTVEYYGYNYDQRYQRSLYINGSGPYSVLGAGNYKMISAALSAGDMGKTKSVNVYGSGMFNRARVRAIIYYLGSGHLIETKTGNCSNNYGGSVSGPLNNGQTGSSSMSLPSGNISHSIGGSGKAGFQYFFTYQYQYQYEIKTTDPVATANGQSASHSGPINNGYWTSWIAAPTGFIVEGANTISHTVAGSGSAKFQFKYDYIRNVPTATGYLKFRGKGQTYSVRIADPTDPSLDYTCVRIYDDAIRCLDVVATTDPEASPLRIYTSKHGTLAFRKVV